MRALPALAALVYATGAAAQGAFMPARSGEAGLLDVPDAEVMGVGRGLLGVELRFDQAKGVDSDFGPLPLYAVGGLLDGLDVGLTMREGGQPGDARPTRLVYGGALKLKLVDARDHVPAIAVDFTADRLNRAEVLGGRLVASTRMDLPIRVSAFVGGESEGGSAGVTWGGALAFRIARGADAVLEGLGGPRGENFGAGVLWRTTPSMGVLLGVNWFPGDEGFRVSVGLGFGPQVKREAAAPAPGGAAAPIAPAPEPLAGPTFLDDQPRFRLKLRIADASSAEPRSLRHGPWTPPASATGPARPVATALRPAAPSLDELAQAQVREQEALADARERRVRATAEQLETREKAALDEARRLAEREGELAAREQQLEAREKRVAVKGAPTQQQRQLESLEAQLASQERSLGAQERSYGPAVDAAQGREREAAAREDAERQEANRLAASVSGAASRALQLEIRRQALGARNRQLSALEARLVAKGERIDALERQLRTRAERLDAWQRRLDTRADRIDLLERRAAEARAASAAPAAAGPKPGAPKEKAVFVMVVKSPTAIMKERAAAPAGAAAGAALHPGVVVEKAVAAATVVMFASPAAQLSELDREAVDNIAKLAAREKCELLIWARAKDPGLMAEAQRRAAELRSHVLAVGPLEPKQVVTRITTRPGAQSVDVVISALRETAKAAAPAAAAPATPSLLAGESGKRQIREAVQVAQPSIEACVGEIVAQKNLQRAEGVLKLTVSGQGRVTKVLAAAGDLSGTALEECLGGASRSWLFPPAEAEYVVDVPITVIRGGAR